MGGNRGRDEIFGVECCVTLHCDWPILNLRKIGQTEVASSFGRYHLFLYRRKFFLILKFVSTLLSPLRSAFSVAK